MLAADLIRELDRYYTENAPIAKSGLIAELTPKLGLKQDRKVFLAQGRYAVRYAYTSNNHLFQYGLKPEKTVRV